MTRVHSPNNRGFKDSEKNCLVESQEPTSLVSRGTQVLCLVKFVAIDNTTKIQVL